MEPSNQQACVGFNPRPRAGGDRIRARRSRRDTRFNPRPRAGGDDPLSVTTAPVEVSIRAPARGATQVASLRKTTNMFQSAPPRGGRRICSKPFLSLGCFNPRPRAGGDPQSREAGLSFYCFNPRPRAGGDFPATAVALWGSVSIRAPARGATDGITAIRRATEFQSAPPRGGRQQILVTDYTHGLTDRSPRNGEVFPKTIWEYILQYFQRTEHHKVAANANLLQ